MIHVLIMQLFEVKRSGKIAYEITQMSKRYSPVQVLVNNEYLRLLS